nr:hypothetical protein [Tanacetum cinerariifolium]
TLTNSINYVPVVVVGTSSTNISGTKDAASQDVKKDVSSLRYIALPNWFHEAHIKSSNSDAQDAYNADAPESSGNSNPSATSKNPQLIKWKPKKISDALKDPSWVEAMQEELLQFKIQNVWILVDCPKGVRPIGTKSVLKNKKDEWGIAIINKARLVAQGHTHEEGIDYEEVFAPVARIETIRLFFAYTSFMRFTVYQMDVKSAFLYGTIDEEAPRAWYGTLSKYLLANGFQKDIIDQTRFIRKHRGDFLLVQVSANTPIDKENLGGKDGPVTPKECHLYAIKRIFRYLKGHPKLGLWYPKDSPFDLVAYSDSDYGGATQDRKSTTRGCEFLGRRLVLWQCKKQTIMATSTTEVEYVAAASGYG